jgi:hypothetical protein
VGRVEVYPLVRMLRPLILAGYAFVAAFSLASELATRAGVGAVEYAVVIALVVALLLVTFRLARRAFGRPANL